MSIRKGILLLFTLVSINSFSQNELTDSLLHIISKSIDCRAHFESLPDLYSIKKGYAIKGFNDDVAVENAFKKKQTGILGPFDNLDSTHSYIYVFEFGRSSFVRFDMIYLGNRGDEQQANNLINKIKSGDISFFEAVERYSLDSSSKKKRGDFGWSIRGEMGELEEILHQKNMLELFSYQTDFGWYIIRKTGETKKKKYVEYIELVEKRSSS